MHRGQACQNLRETLKVRPIKVVADVQVLGDDRRAMHLRRKSADDDEVDPTAGQGRE
jgi:hypothetical protein